MRHAFFQKSEKSPKSENLYENVRDFPWFRAIKKNHCYMDNLNMSWAVIHSVFKKTGPYFYIFCRKRQALVSFSSQKQVPTRTFQLKNRSLLGTGRDLFFVPLWNTGQSLFLLLALYDVHNCKSTRRTTVKMTVAQPFPWLMILHNMRKMNDL